ncbi:MAG TPA: tRNA (adenosine(37)-N6)-threonylcarbamoyltransferase complex dimerization subunit type 1 TsaB [Spirochaetales bacterium]|nr:tRNA (adenosine(37)-N6)-threonylcarbamoyltransferase complex dimerization subunit type 1 TsaB [Spirochaetales bacterium]
MNILALDCSLSVLCAACARGHDPLARGGAPSPKHPYDSKLGHGVSERGSFSAIEIDAGARHAERALGALELVMKELALEARDIDLFVCASGPGSFTGLRIAAATIKGMASALGKPWVGVPTLDAYAAEWAGTVPAVVPVMDARRGRYYAAVYVSGERRTSWLDAGPAEILAATAGLSEILFVGPDAEAFAETASERSGIRVPAGARRPPARALIELGRKRFELEGPAGPDEGPVYVRSSDAEEQEAASGKLA